MIYKKLGKTNLDISVISMGGHEYLPDGRSRGFNEDLERATKTHHIFPDFGGETRKKVLSVAFEHGLNFFDVTQDSEKEALGRNLKDIPPPYEIYIQTRPEGMAYSYDRYNARMAQYDLLKAEVQRIIRLLQRERIDFLNIPFLRSALDHDPEYLDKIRYNLENLKKEGLIRFACADTFSGEYTYMKQIESGAFATVFINFNFADHCPKNRVLPAAQGKGLAVITREAFMKGGLFKMGDEVGFTDRTKLAQVGIKWNLSHKEVTTLVVGTDTPDHLVTNLAVLDDLALTDEDHEIIDKMKTSSCYKAYEARKMKEFLGQD